MPGGLRREEGVVEGQRWRLGVAGLVSFSCGGFGKWRFRWVFSGDGLGGDIYRWTVCVVDGERIDVLDRGAALTGIDQAPPWPAIIPLFSVIFSRIFPAPLSTSSPAMRHPHSSASASQLT